MKPSMGQPTGCTCRSGPSFSIACHNDNSYRNYSYSCRRHCHCNSPYCNDNNPDCYDCDPYFLCYDCDYFDYDHVGCYNIGEWQFNNGRPCCRFCCDGVGGETTTAPLSTLPPECYNPDGASCEWYKECLEKKYLCQDDPNDYAMKYATKYCNQYTKNYNEFSETGQKWVDAVRKCLQVKLVPLINQSSSSVTCKKIKEEAFATHSSCYANPFPGGPSYCDLSIGDRLEVLSTIKSSIVDNLGTFIGGAVETWLLCGRREQGEKVPFRLVRMTILGKASIPATEEAANYFAKEIAEGIVKIEKWDSERLAYVPYYPDVSTLEVKVNEQQITLNMLLADKFVMDNTLTVNVTQKYLNQIIDYLVQSIEQGKLKIITTNGTFYVEHMDKCLDSSCNETDGKPAVAPLYNFAIRSFNSNVFLTVVLLYIFLLKKQLFCN